MVVSQASVEVASIVEIPERQARDFKLNLTQPLNIKTGQIVSFHAKETKYLAYTMDKVLNC